MATVLSLVQRLAQRIDPTTKQGGSLTQVTITATTNASPIVVTAANHGFQTGDTVLIAGVHSSVNGTYTITRVSVNTFSLDGTSAPGSTYSSGTATSLCVSDGDRFTTQRLLDVYNEARFALFSALRTSMSAEALTLAISGNAVEAQIEFTAAGNKYTYALPSGYVRYISLNGWVTAETSLRPVLILPVSFVDVVRSANTDYTQTNTNKFVFEIGTQLVHFGTFMSGQQLTGTVAVSNGGTQVTGTSTLFLTEVAVGSFITVGAEQRTVASIASNTVLQATANWGADLSAQTATVENYSFKYFGITTYAISDVTGGSTTESFNADYHPVILDVAAAIANEAGNLEVIALIKKFVGQA